MSQIMSDGGIVINAAEYRELRLLLQRVASLHPVPGDDLGNAARAWLAALPAPAVRSYARPTPGEPLPRPAQNAAAWGEVKPEAAK